MNTMKTHKRHLVTWSVRAYAGERDNLGGAGSVLGHPSGVADGDERSLFLSGPLGWITPP